MDISNKAQVLDPQFKKAVYARNIWDMQTFNGKIYIGQGDSNANAGPVPVTSFDPVTNKFTQEFVVDDEQIDVFKVLNGKLVIPGHDPREGWELGNYYTLEPAGWFKRRNIPKFIHCMDMEYLNGKYFAVGEAGNLGLVVSDDGINWTSAGDASLGKVGFQTLFVFRGEVYTTANLYVAPGRPFLDCEYLFKFDGTKFVKQFTGDKLLSGLSRNLYQIGKTTVVNNQLLYIAFVGGLLRIPRAMFIASDLSAPVKVSFPETVLPMDILVRGTKTYVLTYKNVGGTYINIMYESTDLKTWTETLRFIKDTFARSFEELNGAFYFGMGTDNTASASTTVGTVLRVQLTCPMKAYCVNV